MAPALWFVAPPLDGPISGGTLYNREIVNALSVLGVSVKRLAPDAAIESLSRGANGFYLVDTLYLSELAELRAANHARRPLSLLCHYLPSLVSKGDALTSADLDHDEQRALDAADAFVAPSAFMQQTIARLDLRGRPSAVVEPATLAPGLAPPRARTSTLRAMMVANLIPGKGVEPFLAALVRSASSRDAFEVEVVGSPGADLEYARACVSAAGGDPRIRFCGTLEPLALIEQLAQRDLLISASRMESFGMALAEARTLGIPIAARAGGNVAALVESAAGGELCRNEDELALAFLSLCRTPEELSRRHDLARRNARPPRGWSDAARELLAHTPRLERETNAK